MTAPISNNHFSAFLECKHKAYLKCAGQPEQQSDFRRLHSELLRAYRLRADKHLLRPYAESYITQNPASLSSAIEEGQAVISDAVGRADDLSCRFDALLRITPCSPSSRPEYVPVLYVPADYISRHDKLMLAFSGVVLATLQNKEIPFGKIIHGPQYSTTRINLTKLLTTTRHTILDIQEVRDHKVIPPLRLNAHCPVCEFRDHCHAEASGKDDLSLLRGLTEKEIIRLNNKGIFTVTQYSYTFRLRKRAVKAKKASRKHDCSLQALAIRTNRIYVTQTPEVPSSTPEFYLDIEALPDRNLSYLIGLLVCDEQTQEYHPFWADDSTAEEKMWTSFLNFVQDVGDFMLFHYGAFDLQMLRRLQKKYGGDVSMFDRPCSASCNVLGAIYSNVYFPTYSNGLKDIASHLAFKWTDEHASCIQSIVWRHRWEATKDDGIKQSLITYNREDCLAVRAVTDTLRQIGAEGASAYSVSEQDVPKGSHSYFDKKAFFFPELDNVNKCAYFDYQRSRVYARTSRAVKRSLRRRSRSESAFFKLNKVVVIGHPERCPQCAATEFDKGRCHSKVVYDLRLTKSGIIRSVVRYRTWTFYCQGCNSGVIPPDYRSATASQYGLVLRAWTVNHQITLRSSRSVIAEHLRDLFGYSLNAATVGYFKRVLAGYYQSTYTALIEKIRHGDLVHADETKAKVKGAEGYVWVFTNLEEVVYVYSDSREGGIVKDVLKGFQGVLVSDFYAVYDSVNCMQQKCLIHLIRDLTDDLFKNPFDEEFKQLGQTFTAVLVPIVETIDRYGLKKHYLKKHKTDVQAFLEMVLHQDYRSAVARNYQDRFAKYQSKLFCFLDYDGVPWNNNNAEHAVKRFAHLKAMISGSSTPGSMQEYLVLLSISETLRRKGISFLRFLASGCTDVDAFAKRHRK